MAKRNSTASRSRQARKEYRAKIKKLQDAGLIGKVDTRKHADKSTTKTLDKYRGFLAGKESAVAAPDLKTAREIRRKFGFKGKGKTVIIPRERGERFHISKKGELTSVRPNPVEKGTRIKKTFGEKITAPPTSDEKLYYTLPQRKRGGTSIRRATFASFDEMLFFLNAYDINFEDIEDYIEIEKVVKGSARDVDLKTRVAKEHRRASRRSKQRRGGKSKTKKSPPRKRAAKKRPAKKRPAKKRRR